MLKAEVEIERWKGCYGGGRGDLFTPESNRHPAKMAVSLCYRIFEHGRERGYWKPGDLILDPMEGIGTTLIVGMSLGYSVVGVELEEHFVRLAWLNYLQAAEKIGPQNIKGSFRLGMGDARRLSEILNLKSSMAGAVTSPPYAGDAPSREGIDHNERCAEKYGGEGKHQSLGVSLRGGGYSGVVTSPPYGEALQSDSGIDLDKIKRPGGPNSQSRLPSNYSGAISSPPYVDSDGRKHDGQLAQANVRQNFSPRSTTGSQIGNLRDPRNDIDAVLTSPPYSQENNRDRHTAKYWRGGGGLPPERNYGQTPGQIELERGETYLSAMLAVYRELRAVLKPGGVVCLVTKNPVKAGKIRRLDEDTIRLMEAAGFELIERAQALLAEDLGCQTDFWRGDQHIRRERKSFFKRLFEKKRPDLKVDHEDVMFFRKV